MLKISYRGEHGRIDYRGPAPEHVPVAAVRKALEDFIAKHSRFTEATAVRNKAKGTLAAAEAEIESRAQEATDAGKEVPFAELSALKADAEQEIARAEVERTAVVKSMVKAYRHLQDTIEKHRAAWHAKVLVDAERAVTLLSTAQRHLATADAEAARSFSVLAMLETFPNGRNTVRGPSPHTNPTSQSLAALVDAIGATSIALERHRALDFKAGEPAVEVTADTEAAKAQAEATRRIHAERAERRALQAAERAAADG